MPSTTSSVQRSFPLLSTPRSRRARSLMRLPPNQISSTRRALSSVLSNSLRGHSRYGELTSCLRRLMDLSILQRFHRTESLDYAIVAKGSVVLWLDDGKKVILNEGGILCQRGTAPAWRNQCSEWARVYFVLLGESQLGLFRATTNSSILQVQCPSSLMERS